MHDHDRLQNEIQQAQPMHPGDGRVSDKPIEGHATVKYCIAKNKIFTDTITFKHSCYIVF